MSQATRARGHRARPVLNTDGRRHPRENALTFFSLIAGLIAFATGWVVSLHVVASWAGLAGLLVGLFTQMISATRQERMLIVTGIIASFVGLAMGLAHGAFLP